MALLSSHNINVRHATLADLFQATVICAVSSTFSAASKYRVVFTTYRRKLFDCLTRKDSTVLIAEIGGSAVGCVALRKNEILLLFILKHFRGKGIASNLLNHGLRILQETGESVAFARVKRMNSPIVSFFTNAQFYPQEGSDEIVFRRTI